MKSFCGPVLGTSNLLKLLCELTPPLNSHERDASSPGPPLLTHPNGSILRRMELPNNESSITPRELALELRCRRMRIYDAIRSGALPALRIGNGYRILPQDRNDWLESLRVK